ncbi:MAG: lipopolysaccharide kinase InaA family protein [Planctomycetales bacterium]
MRGVIHIEPGNEELLSFIDNSRPFESLSEHFGYPLGKHQRRRSKVARKELVSPQGETVVVYFKLYGYRRLKRALSRIFKPTRSQSEIDNLKFFRQLGIPACEPVLQGVYRNAFGVARNCMLITREVTATLQLDDFLDTHETGDDPQSVKSAIRRQILESVASNLRKIHDQNFYHDDMKWRNILVRRVGDDGETVEVFWIDCPNGYFDRTGGFRAKHGRIKDLATLDYDARKRSTPEERMRFLTVYSGLTPDDPKLKELADEVVEYRRLKIDDDRPGRS